MATSCPAGTPDRQVADYSVYLVRCRDGSLYTGIAIDVDRRFSEHRESPKGAKYLRGRGPLELVYRKRIGSRALASSVEARIKRLPRPVKADPAALSRRIELMLAELARASKE